MKKFILLLICLAQTSCTILPSSPSAQTDIEAIRSFDAVVSALNRCPELGTLFDVNLYHQEKRTLKENQGMKYGFYLGDDALRDVYREVPNLSNNIIKTYATSGYRSLIDGHTYRWKYPSEPNIKNCTIELRPTRMTSFSVIDSFYSNPNIVEAMKQEALAKGIKEYYPSTNSPLSIMYSRSSKTYWNVSEEHKKHLKPIYHGEINGITGFPFERRWSEFAEYIAAAFGGKVVLEGPYSSNGGGNYYYYDTGKLIMLPDNLSYILLTYYRTHAFDENDSYRNYPADKVTINAMIVSNSITFKMNSFKTEAGQTMTGYSYAKIDRWPNSTGANHFNEYTRLFNSGANSAANNQARENARIDEQNRRTQENSIYIAKGIMETVKKEQAFHRQLESSTNRMMENTNRQIQQQNDQRNSTRYESQSNIQLPRTNLNTVVQSKIQSNEKMEAICAKIGRKGQFVDGRWQCIAKENQVNIAHNPNQLCYDPSGKNCKTGEPIANSSAKNSDDSVSGNPESVIVEKSIADQNLATNTNNTDKKNESTENEIFPEAVSYCWQTDNKRWLCHSPASKKIVSERILADAEKSGVCDFRDKQPTGNGYIYFCNRRLESYDNDIMEIYKLYGKAALRKTYHCPKGGMTVQCLEK